MKLKPQAYNSINMNSFKSTYSKYLNTFRKKIGIGNYNYRYDYNRQSNMLPNLSKCVNYYCTVPSHSGFGPAER